jgi:hypothetical protein
MVTTLGRSNHSKANPITTQNAYITLLENPR